MFEPPRLPEVGKRKRKDAREEAIPCKIEKQVTLAVMEASEEAARSVGPTERCPMEMTEAIILK
jgi:hypothetical protein